MANLTITNDLSLLHDCNSTTNVTTEGISEDDYKQPTSSVARDTDIETGWTDFTAPPSNLTSTNIYFWIMSLTPAFLDTWENGGLQLKITDTSNNYSIWYVGGSNTYFGGWKRFTVNASTTPDVISGTLNLSSVDSVSIAFKGIAKSRLGDNSFIDYVQYGLDGIGITISDGDTGNKDFNEIVSLDDSVYGGILTKEGGVYYINGTINFADESSLSVYFADSDQLLVNENWYRTFTTSNRTSAESLVTSSFHQINVNGNGTGTTEFQLGVKSGIQGISGCTFSSSDIDSKINFTNSISNINTYKIYGCDFINCNSFIQPDSGINIETLNCSWSGCGLIDIGTGKLQYSKFINSPIGAAALKLDNATNNTSDCQFIGCDLSIELSDSNDYTFNNMVFS